MFRGSGFRVKGEGFRVRGFVVPGFGLGVSRLRVSGMGFRVPGFAVQGFTLAVWGFAFGVSVYRVSCLRLGVFEVRGFLCGFVVRGFGSGFQV